MSPLKIDHYRHQRGFSQQHLADTIGIHVTTLSKIERGHRYLTEPVERRIVAALALTPDERRDLLGLPHPGTSGAHLRLLGAE